MSSCCFAGMCSIWVMWRRSTSLASTRRSWSRRVFWRTQLGNVRRRRGKKVTWIKMKRRGTIWRRRKIWRRRRRRRRRALQASGILVPWTVLWLLSLSCLVILQYWVDSLVRLLLLPSFVTRLYSNCKDAFCNNTSFYQMSGGHCRLACRIKTVDCCHINYISSSPTIISSSSYVIITPIAVVMFILWYQPNLQSLILLMLYTRIILFLILEGDHSDYAWKLHQSYFLGLLVDWLLALNLDSQNTIYKVSLNSMFSFWPLPGS